MQSAELFSTQNTWLHFIGGYYSDTEKFIAEAKRQGISRRVPAQTARGMEFGDRLIFLRYAKKASAAFAEGRITGIMLDHEIAKEVGELLEASGQAVYHDGGGAVERECGSYMICGGWEVKAALSDCIELAIETAEARGQKLFVMIGAVLEKAYDNPIILQPSPNFTRGFTRATEDQQFILPDVSHETTGTVYGIQDYAKNKRPARLPAKAAG